MTSVREKRRRLDPLLISAVETKPRVAGRASGMTVMWCAGVGEWLGASDGGSSREEYLATETFCAP